MTKFNKNNGDILCRTCLKNYSNRSDLIPLQSEERICNLTLAEIIMECASVQISLADEFPQQICNNCIFRLRQAYEFKLFVENSDKILKIEHCKNNYFDWEVTLNDNLENNDNGIEVKNNKPLELWKKRKRKNEKHQKLREKKGKDGVGVNKLLKPFLFNRLTQRHQCKFCERNFASRHCVKRHLVQQHNFDACLIDYKNKINLCQICGYSTTASCALRRHLRIHTGDKPYKCTYSNCQKKFADGSALKCHVKICHLKTKDKFCEICEKTFFTMSQLKHHTRTVHLKERNYTCKICSLSFAESRVLLAHNSAKHLNEKFKCEFCEKQFSYKKGLRRHQLSAHVNENNLPFTCNNCQRRFLKEQSLNLHLTFSNCKNSSS